MTEFSDKEMQEIQKHLQEFDEKWTLFIKLMEDCIKELFAIAVAIDKFHKGATIASVTGSSFGIAGGITTIVGIALAPVTFGVSLIVSGVGIGVAVAGGLAGATASIADTVNIKKKCNRVEEIASEINKNFDCIKMISENIECKLKALNSMLNVQQMGHQISKLGGRGAFMAIEITRLAQLGKVSAAASRGAQLVAQGAQAARAISGVFAVLFILIDAAFIVKGAVDLHKGSKTEAAAEIKKIAENLQITLYGLKEQDAELKRENEKLFKMGNRFINDK